MKARKHMPTKTSRPRDSTPQTPTLQKKSHSQPASNPYNTPSLKHILIITTLTPIPLIIITIDIILSQTVLVSFHHPSFPSLLPKRFFQRLSYIPHKCKLNFGLDFFWKIMFDIFTEYGRSTFFLFDTSHRSDFAAKRYLSNPTGYI